MRTSSADLEPYRNCPDEMLIGMSPLAVGWLTQKHPFATGKVPGKFLARLVLHSQPQHRVFAVPTPQRCRLCGETVMLSDGDRLGSAELRIIGETEIYATPDLIYHYVTEHNYLPPDEFIDAVLHGADPGSLEHRALLNALRSR